MRESEFAEVAAFRGLESGFPEPGAFRSAGEAARDPLSRRPARDEPDPRARGANILRAGFRPAYVRPNLLKGAL
jgi:hypothetical protein